jgi:hypothetical protein
VAEETLGQSMAVPGDLGHQGQHSRYALYEHMRAGSRVNSQARTGVLLKSIEKGARKREVRAQG